MRTPFLRKAGSGHYTPREATVAIPPSPNWRSILQRPRSAAFRRSGTSLMQAPRGVPGRSRRMTRPRSSPSETRSHVRSGTGQLVNIAWIKLYTHFRILSGLLRAGSISAKAEPTQTVLPSGWWMCTTTLPSS